VSHLIDILASMHQHGTCTCRKDKDELKEKLGRLKGVNDANVERLIKKVGCFLHQIVSIPGEGLDEIAVDILDDNLDALARCCCGDHSNCKQWAEDQAALQFQPVHYFCKSLDYEGKVCTA
jgi:hypothetical protein